MASLRRSLLFVPGDDERKIERASASDADTLIFDLEDAVAPARKDDARSRVAARLQRPRDGAEHAVRINAVGTPWHARDLEAVVAAGADAILLPKCDGPPPVQQVAAAIDRIAPASSVRILALIESAAGVAGCSRPWNVGRLDALCFGHVDLALDLDLAEAEPNAGVLLHARCQVTLAARAAGVTAIDSACLEYRDSERCTAEARRGRELGFSGKLCIHPAQVAIVNRAYTPDTTQVARARAVVAAWEEASSRGAGVVAVGGMMVDAPVVARYQAVLTRAAAAAARDSQRRTP